MGMEGKGGLNAARGLRVGGESGFQNLADR
jgi:hypothetical protein